MNNHSRNVVLAADRQFINGVTVTLKSLLFHNPALHIYLMNSDIPQEWFAGINSKINPIGSQISDIKIDPNLLSNEHASFKHISPISYARLLTSSYIDEDFLLYLDSDIVVDGNLDFLFNFQFNDGQLFAACQDMSIPDQFNAGILIINNKQLKKINNLTDDLLKLGLNPKLTNGDQSVINAYFKGQIAQLSLKYNYQAGLNRLTAYGQHSDVKKLLDSVNNPIIIHYLMSDKPWLLLSSTRYRDKWWQYYNLDWLTIQNKFKGQYDSIPRNKTIGKFFTFTASQQIDKLESLIKELPEYEFNIAAYTEVGFGLIQMLKYPNAHVYPVVTPDRLKELIDSSDAYLDINFGRKEMPIINWFNKTNKPIFTFSEVSSHLDSPNFHEYQTVDQLISVIKSLKVNK